MYLFYINGKLRSTITVRQTFSIKGNLFFAGRLANICVIVSRSIPANFFIICLISLNFDTTYLAASLYVCWSSHIRYDWTYRVVVFKFLLCLNVL